MLTQFRQKLDLTGYVPKGFIWKETPLVYVIFCDLSAFRNWMNSMGIKKPVNHLYHDLADGLTLLELFDKIRPGCVNWKKVNIPPFRMAANMKKIGKNDAPY